MTSVSSRAAELSLPPARPGGEEMGLAGQRVPLAKPRPLPGCGRAGPGEGLMQSLACRYYRGTHGVIVVYDVTSAESFVNVKRWLHEINQNCDDVCRILGEIGATRVGTVGCAPAGPG